MCVLLNHIGTDIGPCLADVGTDVRLMYNIGTDGADHLTDIGGDVAGSPDNASLVYARWHGILV